MSEKRDSDTCIQVTNNTLGYFTQANTGCKVLLNFSRSNEDKSKSNSNNNNNNRCCNIQRVSMSHTFHFGTCVLVGHNWSLACNLTGERKSETQREAGGGERVTFDGNKSKMEVIILKFHHIMKNESYQGKRQFKILWE